jgi:uncharacterized protein YaaQ
MKLLLAIVNNDDAHTVNSSLSKEGFLVTKISSTGGFLLSGNSTFLMGIEDDQVEKAIAIIGAHSKKRVQAVPVGAPFQSGAVPSAAQVTVGGATVFVLNVEDCRHL